jgi:membrane protease YdiL (CAAX protease family)
VRRLLLFARMPSLLSRDLTAPRLGVGRDVARAGSDKAEKVDPLRRAVAWSAVLVGSVLPNILWPGGGHRAPYILPLSQTVALVVAAILVDRSRRLRPLAGFLLTIAIIRLAWYVIAPLLANLSFFEGFLAQGSGGARLFVARLLYTSGALLMVPILIARRFSRGELYLSLGQIDAPARPETFLWFRRPIPWTRLGPQLLVVFGIALPAFLFFSLRPDLGRLGRVWEFLPWALATAVLNAANEEFQFRCVPLAQLRNALPLRESLWLTAVFFGLGHYFGQPSGPIGVIMATIAGWIWAKSIVETRGAGWAFGIHIVQDIVIFCFLAMSPAG